MGGAGGNAYFNRLEANELEEQLYLLDQRIVQLKELRQKEKREQDMRSENPRRDKTKKQDQHEGRRERPAACSQRPREFLIHIWQKHSEMWR